MSEYAEFQPEARRAWTWMLDLLRPDKAGEIDGILADLERVSARGRRNATPGASHAPAHNETRQERNRRYGNNDTIFRADDSYTITEDRPSVIQHGKGRATSTCRVHAGNQSNASSQRDDYTASDSSSDYFTMDDDCLDHDVPATVAVAGIANASDDFVDEIFEGDPFDGVEVNTAVDQNHIHAPHIPCGIDADAGPEVDVCASGSNSNPTIASAQRSSPTRSERCGSPLTVDSATLKTALEQDRGAEDGTSVLRCWDHSCEGRLFSSRSNLVRHQNEQSNRRRVYDCPRCGAKFSRTTARKKHIANRSCGTIRRYASGRRRESIVHSKDQ